MTGTIRFVPQQAPVPPVLREDFSMTSTDEERMDAIRRRAYDITQRPDLGSDSENWAHAERELTKEQRHPDKTGERALGTHE